MVERGGSGCFRAILWAAAITFALVCAAVGFIYLSAFPHIPRYASPVSEAADVGARHAIVPYCALNPKDCTGHLRFYRAGAVLLYQDDGGLIALDPATGARLWETSGDFNRGLHPPHLIEFADHEYAYAASSGQVVDLDDGRIAFDQGMFAGPWYGDGRHDPRRVRGGLYRLPMSWRTFLVDLQTSDVAPYAGPGEASARPGDFMTPGWHGPIDQTDDGAFALWFWVGEQNAVVLFSRARQREVWRADVVDAPLSGWIDAAQNQVVANIRTGPRVAFDLTTGRPVAAPPEAAYVPQTPPPAHRAIEIIYEREKGLPEEWRDLDVAATEDLSVVAHYQMRRPPRGFRTRGSYFTEGGTEGGERRLRVTAGPGGPVLLEREMESGRTTTAGYDVAIALSPDGARVAVLPTDGVIRIYDVPTPR